MVRKQNRYGVLTCLGALLCVAACLLLAACGNTPAPSSARSGTEESSQPRTPFLPEAAHRYDLERDEQRGGHTLARHVGKSDEDLRERLRRERNIVAASTWTNRETAELTVTEALRAEQGRIENWIRRGYPRANLALHYDAGRGIGRTLRRGQEQTVECTSAVIVLRADGPDSFYVLTTYPEERE
jgi:hypothetical protein